MQILREAQDGPELNVSLPYSHVLLALVLQEESLLAFGRETPHAMLPVVGGDRVQGGAARSGGAGPTAFKGMRPSLHT
jgi:hypothetical protein